MFGTIGLIIGFILLGIVLVGAIAVELIASVAADYMEKCTKKERES